MKAILNEQIATSICNVCNDVKAPGSILRHLYSKKRGCAFSAQGRAGGGFTKML